MSWRWSSAALVIVLVASGCSSGDDSSSTTSTTSISSTDDQSRTTTTLGPPPADGDGPQVPLVDCRDLLALSEIDDALGTYERDDPPNSIGFSRGEVCTERFFEEEEFFVTIEPGLPADLEPGAVVSGATGEQVGGVGDDAWWFGDGDTPGTGTLSVLQETPVGALVFRIVIGRPDVDDVTRLEHAIALAGHALPRFPGATVGLPEREAITVEPEVFDGSSQSYAANLLAKVDDGEWTLGEGLVATLGLLLGERSPEEVLRSGEVAEKSGGEVLLHALDYLNSGPEGPAGAEIARILDELLLTSGEIDAIPVQEVEATADLTTSAADTSVSSSDRGSMFARAALAQVPGCPQTWYSTTACSRKTTPTFPDIRPEPPKGKYSFIHPDVDGQDEVEGWNLSHWVAGVTAIGESVEFFLARNNIDLPSVNVILTPYPGEILVELGSSACNVYVGTGLQADIAGLVQAIAGGFAGCWIQDFGGTGRESQGSLPWWYFGLRMEVSARIVPDANAELFELTRLFSNELKAPLTQMTSANWVLFSHLDQPVDLTLLEAEDFTTDPGAFDVRFHRHKEELSDSIVKDPAGGTISWEPPVRVLALERPQKYIFQPRAWGVWRLSTVVEPGEVACIKTEIDGAATASWRADEDRAWGTPPAELTGLSLFLITATEPGGEYVIDVIDVVDAGDDPDEACDEALGAPLLESPQSAETAECQLGCELSRYYHQYDFVREL